MFTYSIDSLIPANGVSLFALVDCSIDDKIWRRVAPGLGSTGQVNLFQGTFAKEAEKYAPVLIDLGTDVQRTRVWLGNLIRVCRGKPLLSFLATDINLERLADHLKKNLIIKTADDQEYFLRYADNRILPAIYSVMEADQRQAFFGPIGKWFVANHHNEMLEFDAPRDEKSASLDLPLQLNDMQLTRLLDMTEIHFIVSQLESTQERFSRDFTLAERIQFVEKNTGNARKFGFSDANDGVAWCAAALNKNERFYTHALIASRLSGALEKSMTLSEALLTIPADEWQAVMNEEI